MEPIEWAYGKAYTDEEIVRFSVGTKTYGELWASADLNDWWETRTLRWRATKRKNLFYVQNCKYGQQLLHRVLTKAPESLVVDHIDGNPLNNCRSNLRICTQAENALFGGDRRRGYVKRFTVTEEPTKPHVVKAILADGSVKEYVYKPRAKKRTKTVRTVKYEKL